MLRYRHRVLGMLFLLSMITYIDRVCIGLAEKSMCDRKLGLGLSESEWGLVGSAFALAYAIFEIPTGWMGDWLGPRKVLTRIVVWWSVFTSLTGAVGSFGQLLVVRFLFGAGEAGAYPNSAASISRWFPTAERARAHGMVWMASRVGGALSPLLVIPIQQHFGWRVSFWTFGLLGVIWAVVWYLWYRDTPREKARVTPEEIREIEEGLGPARERHSLPWSIALRRRNFWLILVMYHAYCWGAYFFVFWMPKFLRGGRGFTDDEIRMWAPLPFVFGGVATICGGLASDFLVKRIGLKWGRRAVGATGLTLSAVFMLLTMLTANKLASVLFLACAYAGSDFMLPVAWALCLDVGRKYAGAVTGSMNMAGQVGSALSSAAFGWLVQAMRGRGWSDQHAYNIILPLMAAMLAASALLWLKIDPTRQLVPEEETGRPEAARDV